MCAQRSNEWTMAYAYDRRAQSWRFSTIACSYERSFAYADVPQPRPEGGIGAVVVRRSTEGKTATFAPAGQGEYAQRLKATYLTSHKFSPGEGDFDKAEVALEGRAGVTSLDEPTAAAAGAGAGPSHISSTRAESQLGAGCAQGIR
jgi:hypothetical protein